MPNRNKQKGDRFETLCVDIARKHGFDAQKVPLSGAAEGLFSNDIHIKIGRERWELECKKRATGFKFLYDNLDGADALIVAADRKKPLAVLDYDDFLNLLSLAYKGEI